MWCRFVSFGPAPYYYYYYYYYAPHIYQRGERIPPLRVSTSHPLTPPNPHTPQHRPSSLGLSPRREPLV